MRIEQRVVAIEERMVTKDDLDRMASKEDLAKAKQSVIKWSAGVVVVGVLTGVGLMAAVTFGILQAVLS